MGLARIGSECQKIVCGKVSEMVDVDMGPPLHSLIIAGNVHYLEIEMLKYFAINQTTFTYDETKM